MDSLGRDILRVTLSAADAATGAATAAPAVAGECPSGRSPPKRGHNGLNSPVNARSADAPTHGAVEDDAASQGDEKTECLAIGNFGKNC